MDGTGSLVAPTLDALDTVMQGGSPLPAITSDLKVFGHRMESLLTAIERGGACESYQMQIARALLGTLLDAIDDMAEVRSHA